MLRPRSPQRTCVTGTQWEATWPPRTKTAVVAEEPGGIVDCGGTSTPGCGGDRGVDNGVGHERSLIDGDLEQMEDLGFGFSYESTTSSGAVQFERRVNGPRGATRHQMCVPPDSTTRTDLEAHLTVIKIV
ncbi:hypothetical protein E2562_009473 [Oryza meyeriana var. granulata]|uniref:Uncharacterized protein n=1 Tax=Oryza meyeriana var. granulata TaxID=110450 RepID=A0A6G1BU77_9ORYZ|nr:hypothetical protein E2562_009473 [Oryza meyeriana var. granulata]